MMLMQLGFFLSAKHSIVRVLELIIERFLHLRDDVIGYLSFLFLSIDFGYCLCCDGYCGRFGSRCGCSEYCCDFFYASTDMTDIKIQTFNAHNNYRTLHGCPPLAMSEELSSIAQCWADKIAEKGFLQYSENPGLGENISLVDIDPAARKGEQIVKEWYKEINNYNYNKPGWKRGAYRFSQLLWKSTTEVGIGVARIPGQKKAYVVVNYRPAGNNNMPGEFERNVLPPQKKVVIGDDNANIRKNMIRR